MLLSRRVPAYQTAYDSRKEARHKGASTLGVCALLLLLLLASRPTLADTPVTWGQVADVAAGNAHTGTTSEAGLRIAHRHRELIEPDRSQEAEGTRTKRDEPPVQFCSEHWTQTSGLVQVHRYAPELEVLESKFPQLRAGGRWMPTDCTPRHRVALVVPYRDRLMNLQVFLQHIHPFLQGQQLDYGIYLIEQNGTGDFNRAKLLNVGYEIAKAMHEYDCFIFHDVDLLPENRANKYVCRKNPRHMSTCLDTMKYRVFYETIFGGVSALKSEHVEKVNGFSNVFWGWGGEDDDMSIRLRFSGYEIERNNCSIGRYTALRHGVQRPNPKRLRLIRRSFFRIYKDGLNTLKYRVLDIVFKKLFTHVKVELFQYTLVKPTQ
ncbi:beta-1,4-N-acetylgalactosaminyltransferase bre-4-like [Amblyomma americanum]